MLKRGSSVTRAIPLDSIPQTSLYPLQLAWFVSLW